LGRLQLWNILEKKARKGWGKKKKDSPIDKAILRREESDKRKVVLEPCNEAT